MTEYHELDIDGIRHVTDQAVLVATGGDDSVWVPLMVLSEDSVADVEGEGAARVRAIEVEVWWLEKEGLA